MRRNDPARKRGLNCIPACRVLLQRVLRSPDGYRGLVMEKSTGFDELSQS